MAIHPTAIVDPTAEIGEGVEIGPYSIIGPRVSIGADTWVGPHVVINGPTRIGAENRIFQFASIGEIPQDKKFAEDDSRLEIGDRNTIREYATINRGTELGGGVTRVGDDNWLMAYIHIAHDCIVGNGTIFANNASLAGHAQVDDHAILGGFTLVHQFCLIGRHAFCAMGSAITKDVPPFVMISGAPAHPHGINQEGLRRHGFDNEAIANIRRIYKLIYRSGATLDEVKKALEVRAHNDEEAAVFYDFLQRSQRSIIR